MNEQRSHLLPILLTILISAIVFGSLGYYLSKRQVAKESPKVATPVATLGISSPNASIQPTASVTPSPTADAMANWKTYADNNTGFSFKYPATAQLETATPYSATSKSPTVALVKVYNLKTMEDEPLGYDKVSLTALRDDLTSGKEKTFVSGLYAKETLTLAQLDVCDVQFTRTLDVFDGKDSVVSLSYFIPDSQEAAAIQNNPSYFSTDSKNCGDSKVWKNNATDFVTALQTKKTGALTQNWYDDFNTIAQSFKLTK